MSAFIIVDLTPLDTEKLAQYSAAAAATIAQYNGEFIAKAPIEALNGGEHRKVKVVIQFPDRDAAAGWYQSDDYQALTPLRDQAMDAVFHLVG